MIVINLFSGKKLFKYFCISLAIITFSCHGTSKKEGIQNESSSPAIQITAFPIQNGKFYGYEISIDGKVLIHQEHIPAIEGEHYFQTKELALKVGNTVKNKLYHNKLPSLNKEEVMLLIDNK
jgi:hypothetical protein